MVDNFEIIRELLVFNEPHDFYFLQILQRKKDCPEIGSNSRVIKNYYISSLEYFDKIQPEVIKLCTVFNARASIRLNNRNFEDVAYKAMVNIANTISNKSFMDVKGSYDRACGTGHKSKDKTFILDIDTLDKYFLEDVGYYVDQQLPKGSKVVAVIPSKSGYHIICKPFDTREFRTVFPDVEIHKDNPTNLFIP